MIFIFRQCVQNECIYRFKHTNASSSQASVIIIQFTDVIDNTSLFNVANGGIFYIYSTDVGIILHRVAMKVVRIDEGSLSILSGVPTLHSFQFDFYHHWQYMDCPKHEITRGGISMQIIAADFNHNECMQKLAQSLHQTGFAIL